MKKHLPMMALLITVLATSCNPITDMIKQAQKQQLTVEPNPLELHGDNVSFTLSAKLPVRMMKKKTKYAIKTAYVAGDVNKFVNGQYPKEETTVGTIEFDGNQYADAKEEPKISKKMNFAFEDKHEQGYLIIYGTASKGSKSKQFGPIQIVSAGNPNIGVATTSRLVKSPIDGISNANGVSPFSYAPHGWKPAEKKTKSYNINFEQGSAQVKSAIGENGQTLKLANELFKAIASQFVDPSKVPEFKANGVSAHSPEGRTTVNQELVTQRASALNRKMTEMMLAFDYGKKIKQFTFDYDKKTLEATWPEFKSLIQGSSLDEDQKNEVVAIVDGNDGFVEKEKKLQGLAYYQTMMDEIYPKMRYANMKITVPGQNKSKEDLENILNKITKGTMEAGKLTEQEYLYVVSQNPNYTNRVKWLEKAATKYNTWLINNNLGAAYLDVALLTKDNVYLEKALVTLENAKSKKESGETYYNLGMLYLMKGNATKAQENFQKAIDMGAGSNPALTGLLNGVKAYYAIKKATARDDGKYKEAYELLANATNTTPNRFNQGLAYLLEGSDYEQAKAGFNATIQLNAKDAMAHYGLAITAARQGNASELAANLKKAIDLKSSLKAKALKDAEFFKFKTNASFRDAIK
ncbi:hypothetical protein BKI52_15080 [marine bacterium AO1-C]|nr:hypothetical protein BKI52_15080 [marine bacterium AO1-C]